MIPLTPEAQAQLDGLLSHYEHLDRIEAAENLLAALEDAATRIARAPAAGLTAPRPYPALAAHGFRWIKAGRYWIAYGFDPTVIVPLAIVAVFHDTADIAHRL